jgi:hypothetical protein
MIEETLAPGAVILEVAILSHLVLSHTARNIYRSDNLC